MRTTRALALLAALLLPGLVALTALPPAQAAGVTVTVADMTFSPAKVGVGLGESVTWSFQDSINHTSTSDQGFWDVGPASGGATRTVVFASAGRYDYHCRIHAMMHGRVVVPLQVSGSVQAGWKLRWLAGANPKGRSYDVQMRKVGSRTWRLFRHDTTSATGFFAPRPGTWQVRARTLEGTLPSGWSPAVRLP
jgi:plastocyanin